MHLFQGLKMKVGNRNEDEAGQAASHSPQVEMPKAPQAAAVTNAAPEKAHGSIQAVARPSGTSHLS